MRTTKHFIVMLLCVLLSAPATLAQNPQRNGQTGNAVSQDVLIIIEQQQVRFTARSAVEWMQLQVFNQAGEAVFDSSPVAAAEINWPFQNASGEAIKSGLYAYALSLKEQGAEAARVRRGHLIVDRAQDRDGADKLWVTSQNSSGVGTELTVARDEFATVAGTTTSSERTVGSRAENSGRGNSERGVEAEARDQTLAAKTTAVAAAAGTTGYIAKFTSASDLGNSVISEVNGNVGIGTTETLAKLHVHGTTGIATSGSGAGFFFRNRQTFTPNAITDYWGWYSSGNVARLWKSEVGDVATVTSDGEVTVKGNEPFLTLQGLNVPYFSRSHRIQSAHGDLNFFQGMYLPTPHSPGTVPLYPFTWTYSPQMVIKDSGNIGIGTADPLTRVHVSGPDSRLRLQSSRRDIWTKTEYVTDAREWHTGVGGSAVFNDLKGKYYIHDATAGRTRLTIDTNGLVGIDALQIKGGADFAENFDVSAASEMAMAKVEPGMVVSIDPEHSGKLTISTQAYDSQVAGILSGAGGVKPGMVMSQEGTLAEGKHPVALSGRVYCWADASNGPIKPGDLLTTSDTPGHAMKVSDRVKAQGAIIGKAMTGLKEGNGLVLVLVTLQ